MKPNCCNSGFLVTAIQRCSSSSRDRLPPSEGYRWMCSRISSCYQLDVFVCPCLCRLCSSLDVDAQMVSTGVFVQTALNSAKAEEDSFVTDQILALFHVKGDLKGCSYLLTKRSWDPLDVFSLIVGWILMYWDISTKTKDRIVKIWSWRETTHGKRLVLTIRIFSQQWSEIRSLKTKATKKELWVSSWPGSFVFLRFPDVHVWALWDKFWTFEPNLFPAEESRVRDPGHLNKDQR